MKKIQPGDPESISQDVVTENIKQLRDLFPEVFVEEKLEFEVLKQLLGGVVDDREEKYGLNWHGKRRARRLALTPSVGTLRPCPNDGIEWDSTRNIFIEGDNLEVLKLLQKCYTGKVKLIYIDPPYNTGKDFVYPDDFADSIKNYQTITGQIDHEGRRLSSNSETSGRFHTDWLNMIYPRLKLARSLLRDDGVIFISIDDVELPNLRRLCDEVFGEENFAGTIVWKKKTNGNNMGIIPPVHDYIVSYGKQLTEESLLGFRISEEYIAREYTNPDNDPKGPWTTSDLSANHIGPYFPIANPNTGEIYYPAEGRYWVFNEQEVLKRIADGRIIFGRSGNHRPVQKKYLSERSSMRLKPESWWDKHGMNEDGTEEIGELLTTKVFSHSKPSKMLQKLIDIASDGDDIILDFFAGSGTTGHAVYSQNATDGGKRRFILVQLPEPLDPENKDQKIAADFCRKLDVPLNIAELAKERLRKAALKVRTANALFAGDFGFRVFKLDSSNINAWEPDCENLEKTLLDSQEHIKHDRDRQDVLYELLLKLGLDLCVPIEQKSIVKKVVYSIGAGALIVCLDIEISRDDAEPLALGIVEWHKQQSPAVDTTIVFRDSSFADDVTKTNVTAILQQHGLENVRSL